MHKRFPAIRICAFLLLSTFYKRGINTMDLRQLEYIVAIAEKGNISKAADSLFITQSGLNSTETNIIFGRQRPGRFM